MITEPIKKLSPVSQLLTVSNLSVKRSIDDAQVLKNVNIGISASQKVGIVGESGSSRGDYTASEDDNVLVQGISGDKFGLG